MVRSSEGSVLTMRHPYELTLEHHYVWPIENMLVRARGEYQLEGYMAAGKPGKLVGSEVVVALDSACGEVQQDRKSVV